MRRILEFLSRLIPPLWLGAGIAVSFVAIPVVFSPAIKAQLPAESVGQVAQAILGRFFWVQLGLWGVGLLTRLATFGLRRPSEWAAWLFLGFGALYATFGLHPKLRDLHRVKYDASQAAEVRDAAAADFRRWHGLSQAGNLLLLLTLAGVVVTARSSVVSAEFPANSRK